MTDLDPLFQIGEADNGYNELEVVARNGGVTFTVEEPWAGDTETGFGRACSIRITATDALEFAAWLEAWATAILDGDAS